MKKAPVLDLAGEYEGAPGLSLRVVTVVPVHLS